MGNKNKGKEKTYNIKFIGEINKGEKSYLIKLIKETNNLNENIILKTHKDKTVLKINDINLNLIDINISNKKNNSIIADCIIMEYDINDIESFESIKLLYKENLENNEEANIIYLIGIKIGSKEERTIEEAKNFSFQKSLNFLSLSNNNELDIKNLINNIIENLTKERKINSKNKGFPIQYKVCFIGGIATGTKTSLIQAIIGETFDQNKIPTTNCSFKIKSFNLKNKQLIELYLWDTPPNESLRSQIYIALKGADCVVLGFDLTNKPTFKEIRDWYNIAKERSNANLMYLIGNKLDLYENRQVNEEDARNLANKLNLRYFEVSCLNSFGIKEFVKDLEKEIVKY